MKLMGLKGELMSKTYLNISLDQDLADFIKIYYMFKKTERQSPSLLRNLFYRLNCEYRTITSITYVPIRSYTKH